MSTIQVWILCHWIHSLIWIWFSNFNKNPDFVYKGSNLTILDTKLHSWNSSPTKVSKKKKNATRKEQGEGERLMCSASKNETIPKQFNGIVTLFLPWQKCIPPAFFSSDAEKLQQIPGFIIYFFNHHGRILRRWRGVSRFTYIFSISSNGRLDPSGKLTNFQPPPPPRLPRGPSFSTVNFQPSSGRRLLYLWLFTFPAICRQTKPHH